MEKLGLINRKMGLNSVLSTHFKVVKMIRFSIAFTLQIVVLLAITDIFPISLGTDRTPPAIAQDSTITMKMGADRSLEAGIRQYELNQIDAALKSLEKARYIYAVNLQGEQGEQGELRALNYLGRAYMKINNLEQAALTLLTEINKGEQIRARLPENQKINLADNQANTYHLLQEVLIRQNRITSALEVAERGRARAFADILDRRSNPTKEDHEGANVPNVRSLQTIAHLQKATLVQYSIINETELYIWVIKTQPNGEMSFRSEVSFHRAKWNAQIPMRELLADSRASISVVNPNTSSTQQLPSAELNQLLKELYNVLIKPIANQLPKDPNERVIFIPQGELFLVPFAALQDPQGKYLIENHTISTAPSIQSLSFTRSLARRYHIGYQHRPRPALVVGNPTMPIVDNHQLSPLPGAEQEAIDVAKLLNTTPLIGAQATKSAILEQMPKARIIHFATHGLLDTIDQEIPGAIALAPEGKDTGILTAAELLKLEITPELVVLSACDTGRGTITGDGVLGLSRSLIASGVPSVIASLWAVSDNSTSVLMTHFYRNFKNNPNKAQALRQAMLSTMKEYPNPCYWAAFTLIGESNLTLMGKHEI
jgi:CHAT domain-containing protein